MLLVVVAGALLVASIAGIGLFLRAVTNEYYMGDLRVFRAAPQWLAEGRLYSETVYIGNDMSIPYIYPPWDAVLFQPLELLPMSATAVWWTLVSILSLLSAISMALSLATGLRLGEPRLIGMAMLWTAGALWFAPVRHTLFEGQLGLILMALVLLAVWSRAPQMGFFAGLAAAVKLTPVVALVTLAWEGRWRHVCWALGGILATTAVGFLAAPKLTMDFLLGVTLESVERVGGGATVANQSLRAALSRAWGADVGFGLPWLVAAAVLVGLGITVMVRFRGDILVALWVPTCVTAALTPLSWTHHWVWLIPMVIWLCHGQAPRSLGMRMVTGLWLAGLLIPIIEILLFVQTSHEIYARPVWQVLAGASYVIGLAVVLAALALRTTDRASTGGGWHSRQEGVDEGPSPQSGAERVVDQARHR